MMPSWDYKASPHGYPKVQRAAAVDPPTSRPTLHNERSGYGMAALIGNGRTALADAMDIVTAELEMLINRHFAAHRTLVVSNDEVKFWTAAIGDTVLYRSPDSRATVRFAHTFADRTPGVTVEIEPSPAWSVLVDNVTPIRVEA